MIIKILLVTSLLMLDKYVDSYDWLLTAEKFDAILLRAVPFGHRTVKTPENMTDYAKICNDVMFNSMRPQIMGIFGSSILKIEAYRKSIGTVYKEKLKNKLCDLAKAKDEKYTKFAKEANEVNSKMIPIRDNYVKAMVAAAKPDTTLRGPDVVCFFKRWVSETINCMPSGMSKDIMTAQVSPYMVLAQNNIASPSCDWDNLPPVDKPKFQSIEMLFFEAGKNLAALKSGKKDTSTTIAHKVVTASKPPTAQYITKMPESA